MAITGNPGDLATGGFGTGVRGLAATPRDVANAVSRGEAMASARIGGGGGGNNRAGPLDVYGNEFNFTDEELKNAALSGAGLLFGTPQNPTIGMLMDMQKQVNANPQLKGVLNAIQAPFKAGYQVPSGLLDSAISTATAPSGSFQGFGLPEVDLSSPITSPNPDARYNELYSSLPSIAPMMGVAPTNQLAGYMGSQTMTTGPRVGTVPSQTVMPPSVLQQPNTDTFASGILGSQLAAIKAGENIPSPVSPAITGEGWVDIAPGVNVNSPEVQDLIKMAKAASAQTGRRLTITSGVAPRSAGSLQHPAGVAIDLRAYSPTTGSPLPNYQSPETFSAYESVAKAMRAAQQGSFPQYDDTFRWGGYFSGGPETYGALDLMHFDVNNPRGYGMAGGSFETGLTPKMRETWGINAPTSVGPAGPITVAAAPSSAPAPAPVQTATYTGPLPLPRPEGLIASSTPSQTVMAPSGMAFNAGLLASPSPAPVQTVMAPGGMAFNAGLLAPQILAQAQPQVVEAASAPEAPPAVRPTGAPTRLASLLFDRALERAMERGGEGRRDRRRKKPSTTTEQTMSDTIEGLLA